MSAALKKSFTWDDESEARLVSLHASGLSYTRCADVLGTTRNSCLGKAHRMRGTPQGVVGTPKSRMPRQLTQTPKLAVVVPLQGPRLVMPEATLKATRDLPLFSKAARYAAFAPPSGRVSVYDIERGQCRYADDDGLFCACPIARGSYCAYHAQLVYQPAKKGTF